MKKFCIILALLASAACSKDEALYYAGRSMADVSGGRLVTDSGMIYNVTDQLCAGQIDTMDRVFICYDVLRQTAGGAENEYDIRLRTMYPAQRKTFVPLSAAGTQSLGNDPVYPDLIWEAGGYLNMGIAFERRIKGGREHSLNLGFDDTSSTADSLFFRICHNAFGESYVNDPQATDFYSSGAYVSFDVKDLLQKKDSAALIIIWNGYDSSSDTIATKEYRLEGKWKKRDQQSVL